MNRANGDRIGATRGKYALVGVLAAVLVGVLASNFRGSAGEPTLARADSGPRRPAPAVSGVAAETSPFGEFAVDGDWPHAELDKLVGFDPLAAPPWMAASDTAAVTAAEAGSTEQSLEDVQNAKSAIIFITGGQRVARIGTQDYHVGDMVGRFQIADISSAGIVLSEPVGDARDR